MRLAILYYLAQIQTADRHYQAQHQPAWAASQVSHANITAQVSRLHAPS